MSQANVDIWRASIADIRAAGIGTQKLDPEATIAKMAMLWAPEIEWDVSEAAILDGSGVYQGAEAAGEWWREWFSAWETLKFDSELVDAGDRVVWLLDLRMRGRSTGIEVALGKHAWVATFRDGLIVHQKLYMSQAEALVEVGLAG